MILLQVIRYTGHAILAILATIVVVTGTVAMLLFCSLVFLLCWAWINTLSIGLIVAIFFLMFQL